MCTNLLTVDTNLWILALTLLRKIIVQGRKLCKAVWGISAVMAELTHDQRGQHTAIHSLVPPCYLSGKKVAFNTNQYSYSIAGVGNAVHSRPM